MDEAAVPTKMAAVRGRADELAAVAILIPAWRPNPGLLTLVSTLQEGGAAQVVLVDDGSGPGFSGIFAELGGRPGVHLCRHDRNQGKGRALKSGFAYILREMPGIRAVVTADADGQHTPVDILHVAERAAVPLSGVVLGVRAFGRGVPWRSRLGNLLTRQLFALSHGARLQDTQTGLRGLPRTLLPDLLALPGERYEYEMAMLTFLCRGGHSLEQLPIETVYLDNNRGSHFHPLRDSWHIYRMLLRRTRTPARQGAATAGENAPHLRVA